MLHLLCHRGPLETVCLQQDSDQLCLWPGYYLNHDTAKPSYSGVRKESNGEWNDDLLSSVMRLGSVCMLVMDVHVYGVDLASVIFRSAFAHDKKASPQGSWCGGPSVTTRGQIWCFFRVKQTVPAMLLTQCYYHFFDTKVVCFFTRTTHVHIRMLRRNVLSLCTTPALASRNHSSLANSARMEHDES